MTENPSVAQGNEKPIDILLVEDNEADAKITFRAFSKAKIKNNIFRAQDGQDALDFLNHKAPYEDKDKYPRPDLILMDINMPRMDGLECLKKLKQDPPLSFIPVIMFTSSKNDEDIVKSYGEGAASYMPKPVNYEDFVKAVEGFNFYWQIISKIPDGRVKK